MADRFLGPPAALAGKSSPDWDTLDLDNQELILRRGSRVSLPMGECVILGVLVQAVGDFQSKQVLAAAIYGGVDRWAETWNTIIQNHINALRKRLRRLDCSFGLVTHGGNDGLGWRLTGTLHVVSRSLPKE